MTEMKGQVPVITIDASPVKAMASLTAFSVKVIDETEPASLLPA